MVNTKKIKAMVLSGMLGCIQLPLRAKPDWEDDILDFIQPSLVRPDWDGILGNDDQHYLGDYDCSSYRDALRSVEQERFCSQIDMPPLDDDDISEQNMDFGAIMSARDNEPEYLFTPEKGMGIMEEKEVPSRIDACKKKMIPVAKLGLGAAHLTWGTKVLTCVSSLSPSCAAYNAACMITRCAYYGIKKYAEWGSEDDISQSEFLGMKKKDMQIYSEEEEDEYLFFPKKGAVLSYDKELIERVDYYVDHYLTTFKNIGDLWLFYAFLPNLTTFVLVGKAVGNAMPAVEKLFRKSKPEDKFIIDKAHLSVEDINNMHHEMVDKTFYKYLSPNYFFRFLPQ